MSFCIFAFSSLSVLTLSVRFLFISRRAMSSWPKSFVSDSTLALCCLIGFAEGGGQLGGGGWKDGFDFRSWIVKFFPATSFCSAAILSMRASFSLPKLSDLVLISLPSLCCSFLASSATSRSFFMLLRDAPEEDKFTFLARKANIKLQRLSWACRTEGEMLTKSIVLHSFPRESLSRYVSFEFRKGMWLAVDLVWALASDAMTSPKALKDLLM
mmetsp:Transcript_1169/g.3433  ORF Transcript_1169/g.3433 Transcript_1169/m.3433 type:complete len:213 (-) Transcript_1169:907-1545(-)